MMAVWTQARYAAFREELWAQAEEGYRRFHERLLCSGLPVIGVRVPILRKMAAKIAKEDGAGFLCLCGRETYEERLLYGLVAAALPISYEAFLPYCDTYAEGLAENWAHCDIFCASLKKRIKGRERDFYAYLEKYLQSENPWAARIGLIALQTHYLTEESLAESLLRMNTVRAEGYYVQMAKAWLLATAWAKDRDACQACLAQYPPDAQIFRKFVQKACDSNRISKEDKAYLRSLRQKEGIAFSTKAVYPEGKRKNQGEE